MITIQSLPPSLGALSVSPSRASRSSVHQRPSRNSYRRDLRGVLPSCHRPPISLRISLSPSPSFLLPIHHNRTPLPFTVVIPASSSSSPLSLSSPPSVFKSRSIVPLLPPSYRCHRSSHRAVVRVVLQHRTTVVNTHHHREPFTANTVMVVFITVAVSPIRFFSLSLSLSSHCQSLRSHHCDHHHRTRSQPPTTAHSGRVPLIVPSP